MNKLRKLVQNLIPNNNTNIFSIIINGTDAAIDNLKNMLDMFRRDQNILETSNVKALRNLTSQNGFEPTLFVPAVGRVDIKIQSNFFNENGNEIYLPPYTQFRSNVNGLVYFYNNNQPIKLTSINTIPLTEGVNIKRTLTIPSLNINDVSKFYINDSNIAENSLKVSVDGITYENVKSFINRFDDNVFVVKYSNSIDNPIVIYLTNVNANSIITVEYTLSNGLDGIIDVGTEFSGATFVDLNGTEIQFDASNVSIVAKSGFNFAGNGTSIDTMKSQLGYNINLGVLYDSNSYKEFIYKYSNILLNTIQLREINKSINDIYISKKLFLINYDEYISNVRNDGYKFTNSEIQNFSEILTENEYCLSNHNLFNAKTTKYAFQLEFQNKSDFEHANELRILIFNEFIIFLREKNHIFNVDKLMQNYMDEHSITFGYYIFNQHTENNKLINKSNYKTNAIISNVDRLPILLGDFNIADSNYNEQQLFFDINFVFKK